MSRIGAVRSSDNTNVTSQSDGNDPRTDDNAFFTTPQTSYAELRNKARIDKVEAQAELERHTKMLYDRLKEVEEAAFAGHMLAVRSYVSDARQLVTEFRQARELYPQNRVSKCLPTLYTRCSSRLVDSQGIRFAVPAKTIRIDLSQYRGATDADEQRLEDKINGEDGL
jgi:hypothetical protein